MPVELVQGRERRVARTADDGLGRLPHLVLGGRLVLGMPDPARDDGARVVLGQRAVRLVEHDLAIARPRRDAGLEVVAHDHRRCAPEPLEHMHVALEPAGETRLMLIPLCGVPWSGSPVFRMRNAGNSMGK